MQFHEKMCKLRKEKGISQEGLAEMLGVSRQAVSKWESGMTFPETDRLIALSDIFGVTLDSLLKGSETESRVGNTVSHPYWLMRGRLFEYKSSRTLFGLPLVHVHIGFGANKAKGIVAIGNIATGLISIGLVSIGLISVGLLSLGVIGVGVLAACLLLAIGSVAIGTLSIGAVALGVFTLGAVSIGVYSIGAVAVASRVAVGDHAYAPIAVGRVVKGIHEFISESSAARGFSAVSAAEVRRAILAQFPDTPNGIINWLTWLLG